MSKNGHGCGDSADLSPDSSRPPEDDRLSVCITRESKYEMKISRNSSLWSIVEELKAQSVTQGGKKEVMKASMGHFYPPWSRKRRTFRFITYLFLALAFFFAFSSVANYNSILSTASDTRGNEDSIALKLAAFFGFEPVLEVSVEDMALFEEAKAVSQMYPIPVKDPKIAFMFLTRGPLPLAPLWERFLSGHESKYSVYIHASPFYKYKEKELPSLFEGKVIRSEPVVWSGVSMVAAERRLIATALLDPSNAFFVLVSEACIPLRPFPVVHSYLSSSKLSFITVTKHEETWNSDMLPLVPRDKWRKGDEWKELHRDAAIVVVNDTMYFRKFNQHVNCWTCDWHRTGAADEHYIPTLLYNTRPDLLANRTLHWIDWKNHFRWEHPHTYYPQEISAGLLKELQGIRIFRPFGYEHATSYCTMNGRPSPCFMFARKFSNASLPLLLKLAKPILGY